MCIYFSRGLWRKRGEETLVRKTWSNNLISVDGDTAVFSVKSLYRTNLEVEDLL